MKRHPIIHLATWILARLVPEGERDALVGDLMEEHAMRADTTSSSAALRWFLRQVCASVPPLLSARLRRAAWIATFGVALLAYIAVGVVEWIVNRTIPSPPATGTPANMLLGLLIPFPMVALIAYVAARFRPRAPIVLGAIMLLMVTLMTFTSAERIPTWYRIAYFLVGPAAAFIGSALRSAAVKKTHGLGA
jgi:hypothetical protein